MRKLLILLALAVGMTAGAQNNKSRRQKAQKAAATTEVKATAYTNPVLRGVADAGVLKYAGKYYLGGVATMGDFFVSEDLVNWDKRIHVYDFDTDYNRGTGAKNNQVHSDDITYSGGLFHLFYSANYWGRDRHIVHTIHATSPNIEGPFYEDRDDQWFENRIDPQVFCDEDGSLYLYMVKFTDGNTIWARPMNADFTFKGDAVQQFSSQPGTWETMDNRVAEGPFVIKYHGRYYMMYNANHTAAEYGNYRLGISEATAPMAFNPGNKYPYPVVCPQTDLLEENYTDLIRYGADGYNAVDLKSDTITFRISRTVPEKLLLKLAQRGGIKVWINGHQVETDERADYKIVTIDGSWVSQGENTIVFDRPESHIIQNASTEPNRNHRSSQLVAIALYDTRGEQPLADGSLLLTPGQPNIVRGPNGWEWWLVYMANEGFRRDQYVDRIHFVNDRFTVDAITGHNTSGFHAAPAKPQYSGTTLDGIPFSDSYLLEVTAKPKSGGPAEVWRVEKNHRQLKAWRDNVLVHQQDDADVTPDDIRARAADYDIEYVSYNDGWDEYGNLFSGWGPDQATADGLPLKGGDLFKGAAAADYAFTACFDNGTTSEGRYGVYAAYVDAKNYVRATIDAARHMLVTEHCVKGKTTTTETPLAYTSVHYPDIKYTDSFEKQYRFDTPTLVSEVWYPHLDADNDTYARDLGLKASAERSYNADMAGRMTLEYLDADDNNRWKTISYTTADSPLAAWQRVQFPAVKTQALRMINNDPTQHHRLIYKLKTTRDFQQQNQLRVEKRGAQVHLFVNNRELATVDMPKAEPARIGLYSDPGTKATLRSNLYYPVY